MLVTEPGSGPPHAALHFVAQQQPAVVVAQATQSALIADVGDMDTAFALHDLKHHGDDILVVLGDRAYRLEVVVRHAHESRDERFEAGLRLTIAGGRQGRHGAPVEGLLHDDDRRIVDTLLMPIEARQLDRRLVGFAAGVAEKDFVHAGQGGQFGRQLLLLRHAIKIGRMQQTTGLGGNCGDQLGVIVTERGDGDSRQGVEVDLALGVGHPAPVAVTEGHRQPGISIHYVRHIAPLDEALKLKRQLAPPENLRTATRLRLPLRRDKPSAAIEQGVGF